MRRESEQLIDLSAGSLRVRCDAVTDVAGAPAARAEVDPGGRSDTPRPGVRAALLGYLAGVAQAAGWWFAVLYAIQYAVDSYHGRPGSSEPDAALMVAVGIALIVASRLLHGVLRRLPDGELALRNRRARGRRWFAGGMRWLEWELTPRRERRRHR